MIKNESNLYSTTDISLCATLCAYGYDVDHIDKGDQRRAVFFIKQSDLLGEIVKKYFSHELSVEPISFFNTLKELKTRIYHA